MGQGIWEQSPSRRVLRLWVHKDAIGGLRMATEKRLIYANRLKEAVITDYYEHFTRYHDTDQIALIDMVCDDIDESPTVDAVEVVHGRWIPLEYDGFADGNPVWDLWECSECREEHSGDEDTLTPYCPNCGAKMDGDGNG